jgi:hypothetical protein
MLGTLELTANGKAIHLKSNALPINTHDFIVAIDAISHIIVDKDIVSGTVSPYVIISLRNGLKRSFTPSNISKIGTTDYSPGVCPDAETLRDELLLLLGW